MNQIVWLCDQDHLLHPFIPLAAETLQESGYELTVMDRSQSRGQTKYRHRPVPFSRKWISIAGIKIPGSGRIKTWLGWSVFFFRLLRMKPSIIICDLPMTLRLGWWMKRIKGCKLVYYPFELFGEQHSRVPSRWRHWERTVLGKGIDALITQNRERATVYEQERGSRVKAAVIRNFKPIPAERRNTGDLRSLPGIDRDTKVIIYEGLLIPGRSLENLVRSVDFLPSCIKLVFIGPMTSWWEENVAPLINSKEIIDKIIVKGPVSQDVLPGFISDADAGIIIYDDKARNNRFCEPGKLSDYIFSGIPVVAPDFPTIGALIREYQIGKLFSSLEPEEIARAIESALSKPREEWKPFLEKAASELNWQRQKSGFVKIFKELQ